MPSRTDFPPSSSPRPPTYAHAMTSAPPSSDQNTNSGAHNAIPSTHSTPSSSAPSSSPHPLSSQHDHASDLPPVSAPFQFSHFPRFMFNSANGPTYPSHASRLPTDPPQESPATDAQPTQANTTQSSSSQPCPTRVLPIPSLTFSPYSAQPFAPYFTPSQPDYPTTYGTPAYPYPHLTSTGSNPMPFYTPSSFFVHHQPYNPYHPSLCPSSGSPVPPDYPYEPAMPDRTTRHSPTCFRGQSAEGHSSCPEPTALADSLRESSAQPYTQNTLRNLRGSVPNSYMQHPSFTQEPQSNAASNDAPHSTGITPRHWPRYLIAGSAFLHSDEAKLRKLKTDYEYASSDALREDVRRSIDAIAPFCVGWKQALIESIGLISSCEKQRVVIPEAYAGLATTSHYIDKEAFGKIETMRVVLGIGSQKDVVDVDQEAVGALFSSLRKSTTWSEVEGMKEQEKTAYFDFHQTLDGVLTEKVTNCLLDTKQREGLPSYTVTVNTRGSPVWLGVRFIGSDVYVEYHGYVKRMASFETREDGPPLVHLDGVWRRYEKDGFGILHNLPTVEVGGARHALQVVREMGNEGNSPSAATLSSWRKEFVLILSTSDLRIKWCRLDTRAQTLRCKHGHMVLGTAVLSFDRLLGSAVEKDAILHMAGKAKVSNYASEITVDFDQVVAFLSSTLPSHVLRDLTTNEVVRALYIASSWFSNEGPRARKGKDIVWGNRTAKTIQNCEVVDWIPMWKRELYMAGWRLVPQVITPTGRNCGKLRHPVTHSNERLANSEWEELSSLMQSQTME